MGNPVELPHEHLRWAAAFCRLQPAALCAPAVGLREPGLDMPRPQVPTLGPAPQFKVPPAPAVPLAQAALRPNQAAMAEEEERLRRERQGTVCPTHPPPADGRSWPRRDDLLRTAPPPGPPPVPPFGNRDAPVGRSPLRASAETHPEGGDAPAVGVAVGARHGPVTWNAGAQANANGEWPRTANVEVEAGSIAVTADGQLGDGQGQATIGVRVTPPSPKRR